MSYHHMNQEEDEIEKFDYSRKDYYGKVCWDEEYLNRFYDCKYDHTNRIFECYCNCNSMILLNTVRKEEKIAELDKYFEFEFWPEYDQHSSDYAQNHLKTPFTSMLNETLNDEKILLFSCVKDHEKTEKNICYCTNNKGRIKPNSSYSEMNENESNFELDYSQKPENETIASFCKETTSIMEPVQTVQHMETEKSFTADFSLYFLILMILILFIILRSIYRTMKYRMIFKKQVCSVKFDLERIKRMLCGKQD